MKRTYLFVLALATTGAGFAWQAAMKLPAPFHTESARNPPRVIDRPNGAKLQVPAGFDVQEYAAEFNKPRTMLQGKGAEIFITESVANGTVTVMMDKNKDNKITADEKKQLITGLDRPYGMAWLGDWLYVAESTSVKRYKYDAKAMTAGKGEEIVPMPNFGRGHWTRTIAFDPEGKKLYLGIGSASNVDAGEPKERAAIMRYNPDGSGAEIYASGTRNPTTIRFHPTSKVLWASVQERDALGDDLVPDYFTSIKQGGFYGWPFAYMGPNEDPRRKGEKPELVKSTIAPDVPLGAHVAVIDWNWYNGKMFPAEYQGGAFLALHGSWNRSKRVGQSVVFVPFKDGKPTTNTPKEFLTGWMLSPDKVEVWGRPTGIFPMQDGSLLVSDDGGNKVWRITYKK
jgi:glucose/arabinose dehydrogenase